MTARDIKLQNILHAQALEHFITKVCGMGVNEFLDYYKEKCIEKNSFIPPKDIALEIFEERAKTDFLDRSNNLISKYLEVADKAFLEDELTKFTDKTGCPLTLAFASMYKELELGEVFIWFTDFGGMGATNKHFQKMLESDAELKGNPPPPPLAGHAITDRLMRIYCQEMKNVRRCNAYDDHARMGGDEVIGTTCCNPNSSTLTLEEVEAKIEQVNSQYRDFLADCGLTLFENKKYKDAPGFDAACSVVQLTDDLAPQNIMPLLEKSANISKATEARLRRGEPMLTRADIEEHLKNQLNLTGPALDSAVESGVNYIKKISSERYKKYQEKYDKINSIDDVLEFIEAKERELGISLNEPEEEVLTPFDKTPITLENATRDAIETRKSEVESHLKRRDILPTSKTYQMMVQMVSVYDAKDPSSGANMPKKFSEIAGKMREAKFFFEGVYGKTVGGKFLSIARRNLTSAVEAFYGEKGISSFSCVAGLLNQTAKKVFTDFSLFAHYGQLTNLAGINGTISHDAADVLLAQTKREIVKSLTKRGFGDYAKTLMHEGGGHFDYIGLSAKIERTSKGIRVRKFSRQILKEIENEVSGEIAKWNDMSIKEFFDTYSKADGTKFNISGHIESHPIKIEENECNIEDTKIGDIPHPKGQGKGVSFSGWVNKKIPKIFNPKAFVLSLRVASDCAIMRGREECQTRQYLEGCAGVIPMPSRVANQMQSLSGGVDDCQYGRAA